MNKITGVLNLERSKHLLNRAAYNVNHQNVTEFEGLDIDYALDRLFEEESRPMYGGSEAAGQEMQIFEWWVRQNIGGHPAAIGRLASFIFTLLPAKLAESHAAVASAWLEFLNWAAYASYKDVIKVLPLQNNMNRRLNLNNPNENFGREVLEFFTLGTGGQVSKTDYVNYTQGDVISTSKVFSGYFYNHQPVRFSPQGWINAVALDGDHNKEPKPFSDRFGSVTIDGVQDLPDYENMTAQAIELEQWVEMVFAHPAMGELIIEKLLRFYASDAFPLEVRDHLIQIWKDNNFLFEPVLRELFSLEWFYSDDVVGDRVQAPFDMFMKCVNFYEASLNATDWLLQHETRFHDCGQPFMHPQEIAGDAPNYQAPKYTLLWIQHGLLQYRYKHFSDMVSERGGDVLLSLVGDMGFDDACQLVFDYCLPIDPSDEDKLVFKSEALGTGSASHWNDDKRNILNRLAVSIYRSANSQMH